MEPAYISQCVLYLFPTRHSYFIIFSDFSQSWENDLVLCEIYANAW